MKLNNSDQMESYVIRLDEDTNPIAFKNRVESLISSGLTESEAKKVASEPIHVEMYYDKNAGLFLVESDGVEAGTIYNPYSGKLMEDFYDVE